MVYHSARIGAAVIVPQRVPLMGILLASFLGPNVPCVLADSLTWKHFASTNGKARGVLPAPSNNKTAEQTCAIVIDADRDGIKDFAITERSASPSVVLYRRTRQ